MDAGGRRAQRGPDTAGSPHADGAPVPFEPPSSDHVATALQVVAPLLWIAQAGVIARAIQAMADGAPLGVAMSSAMWLVLLAAIRHGLDAWGRRRAYRRACDALDALRERALDALMATSPIDLRRPHAGHVAHALAEQAESALPYLARFDAARWRALLVPLAILPFVAHGSWLAALVLLVAAPIVPLFMALIGWRAQAASEAQLAQAGDLSAFLLDRLRGLPTLRALGAVPQAARRLHEQAAALRERTMAVLRIAFLSSAVLELFASLGVALVAVYVGLHLLGEIGFGTWGRRLSIAEGIWLLMLAPAYFEPLRELAQLWHDRANGRAAIDAMRRLTARGEPLPPVAPAGTTARGALPIDLRDVSFTHAGATRATLEHVTLHVAAGERVALVGANGAGKSTLLALIAGLAMPSDGRARVGDGTAAPNRIGWMAQRPALLARSAAANVGLSRPDVDAAAISSAMRRAGWASARLAAQTPLGEGGEGLSGGEARRLALARAWADPACGLLLADEPTAHLDDTTAAELIDALLGATGHAAGRTLLVATHDPRLIERMDRVIRVGAPSQDDAPHRAHESPRAAEMEAAP